MAERLTDKNGVDFTPECTKVNPLLTLGRCPFYDKLGKLEDILEKYGIEGVEELENIIINGLAMLDIQKINILKEMELKTDRDTWKRACELAWDVLRDINYKIYNEDRIDFENTFYQQAKKEGNDERKN